MLLSKTIDFLRFPLIVGVVFIPTDFSNFIIQGSKQINILYFPVFAYVFFLFSKFVFEICVPLFFFISGFFYAIFVFSLSSHYYTVRLLFYWAIKKLLPSFTAVICGGRLS